MHVMIINGSPRVEKYSNTDKIIAAFAEGLSEAGATFEKHAVSRKESWPVIREAYTENTEIVIALPLFVENIPGLLLEFLETLRICGSKPARMWEDVFGKASGLSGSELWRNPD